MLLRERTQRTILSGRGQRNNEPLCLACESPLYPSLFHAIRHTSRALADVLTVCGWAQLVIIITHLRLY